MKNLVFGLRLDCFYRLLAGNRDEALSRFGFLRLGLVFE